MNEIEKYTIGEEYAAELSVDNFIYLLNYIFSLDPHAFLFIDVKAFPKTNKFWYCFKKIIDISNLVKNKYKANSNYLRKMNSRNDRNWIR